MDPIFDLSALLQAEISSLDTKFDRSKAISQEKQPNRNGYDHRRQSVQGGIDPRSQHTPDHHRQRALRSDIEIRDDKHVERQGKNEQHRTNHGRTDERKDHHPEGPKRGGSQIVSGFLDAEIKFLQPRRYCEHHIGHTIHDVTDDHGNEGSRDREESEKREQGDADQ